MKLLGNEIEDRFELLRVRENCLRMVLDNVNLIHMRNRDVIETAKLYEEYILRDYNFSHDEPEEKNLEEKIAEVASQSVAADVKIDLETEEFKDDEMFSNEPQWVGYEDDNKKVRDKRLREEKSDGSRDF